MHLSQAGSVYEGLPDDLKEILFNEGRESKGLDDFIR